MFFQQINIFIIWTVYFANIKDTFRIVIHVLLKSEQKRTLNSKINSWTLQEKEKLKYGRK